MKSRRSSELSFSSRPPELHYRLGSKYQMRRYITRVILDAYLMNIQGTS